MARTNWTVKDSVLPSDMNAIGEEINELQDGFVKKSIVIPAGSDLNTYMEEGGYYCPANATVATLLNSPTAEAFHLTVEPHAGVLQTLTTFQPDNMEVFQRNYYFGWGPWEKVPSRDELEEIKQSGDNAKQEAIDAALANDEEVILPQANANAQGYANAAVLPIINAENSNGILNSAANQGLTSWKNIGTVLWDTSWITPNNRGFNYFAVTAAVPINANATLEAVDQVLVSSGPYNLQAVFNTSGMGATGQLKVEIINTSSGLQIGTLEANPNTTWHRKSTTITIPAGVLSVKIRLVVFGGSTGVGATVKGVTRIKFSAGAGDVPYTDESDSLSVLQYANKMRSWGAL
ncbi:pyocin knob domain-containing protein [Paenibacillus sp. O199]|uniref:pyocin knob domain-containing protein n=1 Tax=Paenibacillus sp. O199 TaxID=1643925 RepID=UPI0007BEAADD|nr:pyocin knob domain-containing protein [Paenibacillus sp. O199]